MLDLDSAAREVARLLDGVNDDQLGGPNPCADTTVTCLLEHLLGLSLAFTSAARKTTGGAGDGSVPGSPTTEHLDPNWRTLLPERLGELADAWRDPMAWTGMTEAGGMRMAAKQMGAVALDELVLHGWDLARATGQRFTCDPASTAAVLAFSSASAHPERAAGREGLFAPMVDVPADASAFDRALGFAGRDPGWTPASA